MSRVRAGWQRLSAPGDKCSARWLHTASGWEVRHCGHPTANWPYSLHPRDSRVLVVSACGRGFRRLVEAQAAVEGLFAGELVTVDADMTYAGAPVRRVAPVARRRRR